jgi:hypothetical protein
MIAADVYEQDIYKATLEAGMTPLYSDGLKKAAAGITTLEELMRVIYFSRDEANRESVCEWCSKPIIDFSKICPHCGHLIKKECSVCGKPIQSEWILCPYCATRFEN